MHSQNKQTFFSIHQELLVNFGVVILCLFSSSLFPVKNPVQTITRDLFFLVLLPLSYIKIILGKDLANFGWNLKNQTTALKWGVTMFFFTLLLFYLLLNFTDFKLNYTLGDYVRNNFWLFLTYELFFVNFSIFIFSFFFQGFFLSIFQEKFGSFAIAFQTSFFLITLFFTNSLSWQMTPFILLSVTGGFLALKTNSFFYSYFMNIFAIIILDTYFIYLTR